MGMTACCWLMQQLSPSVGVGPWLHAGSMCGTIALRHWLLSRTSHRQQYANKNCAGGIGGLTALTRVCMCVSAVAAALLLFQANLVETSKLASNHTDLPPHVLKELATKSATVTPWWWGLRTLIKASRVLFVCWSCATALRGGMGAGRVAVGCGAAVCSVVCAPRGARLWKQGILAACSWVVVCGRAAAGCRVAHVQGGCCVAAGVLLLQYRTTHHYQDGAFLGSRIGDKVRWHTRPAETAACTAPAAP